MSKKLIKCKVCGEDIAKTAKTCPKCGAFMLKHHYKNGRALLYCSNDACETRIDHPINKELDKMRQRAEAKKARDAEKAAKVAKEEKKKE